jgi:hypothetical protein
MAGFIGFIACFVFYLKKNSKDKSIAIPVYQPIRKRISQD